MIMELIEDVDYDIAKSLNPDTAEDPDEAEESMASLVAIVKKHLK